MPSVGRVTGSRWAVALVVAGLFGGCTGVVGDPSRPEADGWTDPTSTPPTDPPTVLPREACDVETLGHAPLRRLTRLEYDNTVQALLGISDSPAARFTDDESVGPFASNPGQVSVLHLDQFASAAEHIAETIDAAAVSGCGDGAGDRAACIERFIRDFGARAFRAPLDDAQVDAFLGLQAHEASVSDGVRVVVSAMLQSPQFVYHLETSPGGTLGGTGVVPLDDYAVASRLSYFLWRSMPDDQLFAAAARGELGDADVVEAHARRMLDDPRARRMVREFYIELLTMQAFDELDKEYEEFTPAVRTAMLQETMAFIDYSYWEAEGSFADLLTSAVGFVDGSRVDLDPSRRAGVLTHPSVLSVLGKRAQSAPIQRGALVREHFLCESLPSPPLNVMVDDPPADPNVPRRQQFQEHSENAACAGCHTRIDPVGFGFEHYDGMGRFRASDGGEPVDASGRIVGSADIDGDGMGDLDGEFYGAPELARALSESEQARQCAAIQWFRYATGRLETTRDRCALRAIVDGFEESGFSLHELLVVMATSEAFRSFDVAAEPEEVAP